MKKPVWQLLITLLVFSFLLTPVFAFGTVAEGEGEATLLQEGSYEILKPTTQPKRRLRAAAASASTTADDFLYSQLYDMSSSINLSSYNISINDIGAIYGNVINCHPDLFYVSGSFRYSYYPSTNTIANLTPTYWMTQEEVAPAREIFYTGAAKALAEVDDSMTDLQKALTLHEYLCSNGIYPDISDGSQTIHHSAYGFFYNHTVVCQGFSLAYIYLLQQLEIECTYVSSDSMNHAWNKVKLDGNWYNVDVTWDNFDMNNGRTVYDQNLCGSIRHSYFLKSDSYFTDSLKHYGGTTYADCSADSTDYDDAFWNSIPCARIYVVNGDYYYLNPNNGKYGILYLTKRTVDGIETKLGSYFTTSTLNYGTFTDALARLAWLDNRFYVVAEKAIYSVLLNGTQYTITAIDQYAHGLGVNDNRNLFWQPYEDVTTINELDKLAYFDNYMTIKKQNGAAADYNNYPDINLDGVVNAKDYALIIK